MDGSMKDARGLNLWIDEARDKVRKRLMVDPDAADTRFLRAISNGRITVHQYGDGPVPAVWFKEGYSDFEDPDLIGFAARGTLIRLRHTNGDPMEERRERCFLIASELDAWLDNGAPTDPLPEEQMVSNACGAPEALGESDAKEDVRKRPARKLRGRDRDRDLDLEKRIQMVVAAWTQKWGSDKNSPPASIAQQARALVENRSGKKLADFSEETIGEILAGRYRPMLGLIKEGYLSEIKLPITTG